jgi:CRP-like cAMP-binding protein
VAAEYPVLRERVHRLAEERMAQSQDRPRRAEAAPKTLYDILAQVPLFAELPPAVLTEIAQSVKGQRWAAGEVVVKKGAAGESCFLVLQGELEVEVATRPRLRTGDFFGELSLLCDWPRSATVRAVVDTELAELHRRDFETLLKQYPDLQTRIRAVAEHRLQERS